MDRVKDKVAVVTGGGKGIGRACTEMLAREGARVILTQRHEEEGRKVASSIRDQGLQAAFVAQDVTREDDWEHVLEETRKHFGQPDILVNNAGIYIIEKLEQTSVDQWKKLMDINSMGVFLGMRTFAPAMEKSGGGSIVNLSSVAGVIGTPGHVLYSASKGAVLTMTKDVAIEYAKRKVRVNAVQPGYVDTGMADYGAEEQDSTKKDLGQWHPMGRIGTPEEIAYAVLYLASDEAAFVTGASLLVDGGLCAQ
ncbi:MAG: SDR family NAD(P)-dependent oxidoreductase [Desulfonatronovibrionaceae bacterium]